MSSPTDPFIQFRETLAEYSDSFWIFDFDQTLADLQVNWAELKSELGKISGFSPNVSLTENLYNIQSSDPSRYQRCIELIHHYEKNGFSESRINHQLIELINQKRQSHNWALFSANTLATLQYALPFLGFKNLPYALIGKESVPRTKPDPDGVDAIRSITEYKKFILVGDSPVDAETARRSRINFIEVPSWISRTSEKRKIA